MPVTALFAAVIALGCDGEQKIFFIYNLYNLFLYNGSVVTVSASYSTVSHLNIRSPLAVLKSYCFSSHNLPDWASPGNWLGP